MAWSMGVRCEDYLALRLVLCQTHCSTADVLRAKLVCAYRALGGAPRHSFCQEEISTALQMKRNVALGVGGESFSVGAVVP